MTSLEPWRPGVITAGSIFPDCMEWSTRFMLLFLDDAARGLHPDLNADRAACVASMYQAALEAEQIIRRMMSQ